jgi:hypothetical protein
MWQKPLFHISRYSIVGLWSDFHIHEADTAQYIIWLQRIFGVLRNEKVSAKTGGERSKVT